MKKLFSLFLSSIIGGTIAVLAYVAIIDTDNTTTNNAAFDYKRVDTPVTMTTKANSAPIAYNSNLDFTGAAEKTVNAVVHVKVRSQVAYENPFYNFLFGSPNYSGDATPVVSSGSGVIISNDGYIVTNNHVIDGADILEVTLNDKRTFTANVIGADPTTDIALIKIKGENFPYIPWGDSDDVKVGEWVLAVGNPFNLASTVTAGIVSAKARSINILNKSTAIEAFIQTDAAVNPGNSGGALVNTKGELIGINTAIASPTGTFSGYSFAVPERIAKKIVSDLVEFGTVQRAFIGVSIIEVTSEEAKRRGIEDTKGVFVMDVSDGGAAKDAGVKPGDIILKVAGEEVNSTSELQEKVGQYRPGDELEVVIKRDNKVKDMMITLRNIQGSTEILKGTPTFEIFGATFEPADADLASKLRIKGGVQISGLSEGKFRSAGIKEGFIITSINRTKVYDLDDLRMILNNSKGGIYIEGVYPNGIAAYYAFGI